MNRYLTLKETHQKESDAFPMAFAFSNQQFEEGMRKLGLDPSETNKVFGIIGGGFYRKTDAPAFREMLDRHEREMAEAIAADETGEGFIFEMFRYELANHEYCITWDVSDTLRTLGLTPEEVNADPCLKHGLKLAREDQFAEVV